MALSEVRSRLLPTTGHIVGSPSHVNFFFTIQNLILPKVNCMLLDETLPKHKEIRRQVREALKAAETG